MFTPCSIRNQKWKSPSWWLPSSRQLLWAGEAHSSAHAFLILGRTGLTPAILNFLQNAYLTSDPFPSLWIEQKARERGSAWAGTCWMSSLFYFLTWVCYVGCEWRVLLRHSLNWTVFKDVAEVHKASMRPTQTSTPLPLPLAPRSFGGKSPRPTHCQRSLLVPQGASKLTPLLHNSTGQVPLWLAKSDLDMLNSRNPPLPFIRLLLCSQFIFLAFVF